MTGRTFLPAQLGLGARIATEAAFGADLADITGAGWVWTDLTADLAHAITGTTTTGRGDNIGQAPTARCSFGLNNPNGDYTAGNPTGANYPNVALNTPIRRRLSLDGGATWKTRFQGYADSWNPNTDTSAKVKRVAVSALGMLGRLDGRKKPLSSALYRAVSAQNPVAHWPMDDGTTATSFASAVSGGAPLRVVNGPVAFGGFPAPAGATTATALTGAVTVAAPVAMSAPSGWSVGFAFNLTSTAVGTQRTIMTITTTTGWTYAVEIADASPTRGNIGFNLAYRSPDQSVFSTLITDTINHIDGQWHYCQMIVADSGTTQTGWIYVDGILTHGPVNPVFVMDPGSPTGIIVGQDDSFAPLTSAGAFSVAGVALWADTTVRAISGAVAAWAGETASARLIRLCTEEGVALDLTGTSAVAMGPQTSNTITALLRECEAADHGLLYDGLGPGIGYRCRSSMHNQTPALTLNMAAQQVAPPFEPVFDRQNIANTWKVDRASGSSALVEKTDGPLGTAEIGTEDKQATLNVATDAQLASHAGWLVSLGTVEGFRFPGLNLNMRAISGLAVNLLALKPGDLIRVTNPRSVSVDLPPEAIDLIAEGWSDTTTADSWLLALNCSPGQPWRIATVNGVARVQAAASKLSAGITAVAASATVTGPLPWTTRGGMFPLDIMVGGERITVSSITGAAPPQTFNFAARHVNGITKAHSINEPVTVADPTHVGL